MYKPKGYAGFGSFQIDVSVEAMIRTPQSEYTAPPRAVCTDDLWDSASAPAAFGNSLKCSNYFLDPSWTFLNHGAFGGACRVAVRSAQRWSEYAEQQPLRFIDRELFPLMCHSVRCLASLVKCPPTSLVLVSNATYALSSIIESFPLPTGAVVFCLDIGYGSVKTMLLSAVSKVGGKLVVGKVSFPLNGGPSELVSQIAPQIPPDCVLAVFDYVTSNTGMVLPVFELTAAAKAVGAKVLIDGAHALGAFDLDIPSLGADYFVSNCHKWLCSSRGLGMLYASPSSPTPRAAVISHGYGSGFSSEFIWDGCRDYGAAVALPTLLKWWDWVGLQGAREYSRGLLISGVKLLREAWKTDTHVPDEFYSHMACIQIPPSALPPGALLEQEGECTLFRCTSGHSKMIQDALHHDFSIEVPAKTLPGPLGGEDSRTYLRVSAFVYNTFEDFEALAEAVLRMEWEENGSLKKKSGRRMGP